VSLNAKTAGSGDTQHSHAEHMGPNAKNAMDHTRLNTIEIWHGVARPTPSRTPQDLRLRKAYNFKCANCKGDHHADSTECLFWRHRFNCQ